MLASSTARARSSWTAAHRVKDEFGLTDTQLEALAVAQEMGYFEVPRATDLDEVAAELGLSHQSLSELLRRGQNALIQNTIQERNHFIDDSS